MNNCVVYWLSIIVGCFIAVLPASSQTPVTVPNTSPNKAWEQFARADEATQTAITAVIKQLFNAMATGDTSLIRPLFYDVNERMQSVQHYTPARGDTTSSVSFDTVHEFLNLVGKPKPQGFTFEERILSYIVFRDGDFACVWCPYEVYVRGQFRHCGVDVFNMIKTQHGWKIMHIADTRRTEGCR